MFRDMYQPLCVMVIAACIVCIAPPLHAKVPAAQAARLKRNLTPIGAERAGNAEGTIPAWEPMTGVPEHLDFNPASGDIHPDPFAEDKVLFTITAENADQYADQISPGMMAMFKKYPDSWKMHVYPTHRIAAFPQDIYERTYDNALNGELINGGDDGFEGVLGGVCFPIPQNGAEAIYNHIRRYICVGCVEYGHTQLVHANGRRSTGGAAKFTYNDISYRRTKENYDNRAFIGGVMFEYFEPARRKGEIILAQNRGDYRGGERGAWQYMPGQRRVRRAPSIAHDTPNPTYGGYGTYDDGYMFNGRIDRFNWTLKGKKEMIVPYNNYRFELASLDDICTPRHLNPEFIRWERHRVWVIEATLREGKRHCYGRRVFYQDEDSWIILLKDNYDTRGNLWRASFSMTKHFYDLPVTRIRSTHIYDLQTTSYCAIQLNQGMPKYMYDKIEPEEYHTPQMVRKLGKR